MGRKKLYEQTLCSCCGKEKAIAKGLCAKCYHKKRFAERYIPVDKSGFRTKSVGRSSDVAYLIRSGINQSDVADILGISRQAVFNVVKRMKKAENQNVL